MRSGEDGIGKEYARVHLFSKYAGLSIWCLEGRTNRMKHDLSLKELMVLLGQQNTLKSVNANGTVDK